MALLIVTYLHVIFGEMVPKNISFSLPDKAVLFLAPPLVFVSRVISPIIRSLNAIANGFLRMTGVEPKTEAVSAYTLDEVATIVAESTKTGMLSDHSGALTAAFEFTTKVVGDVTIGLPNLVTLPEDATPADVHQAVAQRGFSRYVLVEDIDSDYPVPPRRIRSLVTLRDSIDLEDALATLRQTGAHVAKVVAPDGATRGVLFLEDIIEELVGEVRDATTRH
jgi:CBS domain containing-hemolysin-like protein